MKVKKLDFCINKITQIYFDCINFSEFIKKKLDIQATSFGVVDDVLNMTNSIDDKVSGIDDTHQQIRGTY